MIDGECGWRFRVWYPGNVPCCVRILRYEITLLSSSEQGKGRLDWKTSNGLSLSRVDYGSVPDFVKIGNCGITIASFHKCGMDVMPFCPF